MRFLQLSQASLQRPHESFDINKWNKETEADDKRRYEFTKELIQNKDILDFGSGNGGYLNYASKSAKSISALELETAILKQYKEYGIELTSIEI